MNGINSAFTAGASGAAILSGGSLRNPNGMSLDVVAVEVGARVAPERFARSGSAVPAPRPSDMSPVALVSAANRRLAQEAIRLEFVVRHDPAGVVVRLVDVESGDVIRQYSTAEVFGYIVSGSFKPGRLFYDAV